MANEENPKGSCPPPPAYNESSAYPNVYPEMQHSANPAYPPVNAQPTPMPQQQGAAPYPTAPPQAPPVITVQPVTMVHIQALGAFPCNYMCPNCRTEVLTQIQPMTGLLTWLLCGVMFIFGFWICCFFPFCIDSCQDVEHRCPRCKAYLGTFKRL